MLIDIANVLDWFGLIIFATTGCLTASRQQMDIIGFMMLATVTGVGGGTLRDMVLGLQPVFWIEQPIYLGVCIAVAGILFFTAHIPQSRIKLLLWLDALGLALFAVTGTQTALNAGIGYFPAITMGVITAVFGGIIRDLLGGEIPVVRRPEIYITAALVAAGVYVGCLSMNLPQSIAMILGFFTGFSVRAAALFWGLSLPRYRPREINN